MEIKKSHAITQLEVPSCRLNLKVQFCIPWELFKFAPKYTFNGDFTLHNLRCPSEDLSKGILTSINLYYLNLGEICFKKCAFKLMRGGGTRERVSFKSFHDSIYTGQIPLSCKRYWSVAFQMSSFRNWLLDASYVDSYWWWISYTWNK